MKLRKIAISGLLVGFLAVPLLGQGVIDDESATEVAKIVEQLSSDSATIRESASKKLDELDDDALESLKKHLEDAKLAGDVDLELKLQNAVDRITKAGEEAEESNEEGRWTDCGGIKLRISPGGSVKVKSRTDVTDGESRTVTESDGEKTTTLTQEEEGGKVTYKVTDADGNEVESGECESVEALKKDHPELHKIWKGSTANGRVRLIDPNIPEDMRKRLEELDEEVKEAQEEAEREMKEFEKLVQDMLRRLLEKHGEALPPVPDAVDPDPLTPEPGDESDPSSDPIEEDF